jgi:hypothetical protein
MSKSERRKSVKNDIRFAKNLIKESQVVMQRIVECDETCDKIRDKIDRIKNALDIDVEEFDRILKEV